MRNLAKYLLRIALLLFPALLLSTISQGQDFTLSAVPGSVTVYPGEQNVAVTINSTSNIDQGPITVTVLGLPSGVTASNLVLAPGASGTLYLSATVSAGQEGFSNMIDINTTNWIATATISGTDGATQATSPLAVTMSISNPTFAPAANAINLPIVQINTNGAAVTSKDTDVPGMITITSANGATSYLPNSSDSDNTATFHVHGNSTALMPKLAYAVKLNTSLDLLTTMGLSCPYKTSKSKAVCDKSKSYILLANYDDKTFIRDWSASALANAIPIGNGYLNSPADSPTPSGTSALMPWAPHSLFVELYLNGVYEGDYQLIEKASVDSNKINIHELAETDTTDDITGGYFLEIDQHEDEDFVFFTPTNLPIGLLDPDYTPEVPEQTSYISSYVDTAESALTGSNSTDPTLGWRAYFDEASAVNFYIVNDLMGNVDGGDFVSSDYLYKNIDNPLLYMGPIWDFDGSSGNVNYALIVNPTLPGMKTHAVWYQWLFKDPGFQEDVATQWNTLKNAGVFSNWIASIQQQSAQLEQTQANNFGRWPMQGIMVWPNPQAAGSYDAEVQYMVDYLNLRFGYLDSQFNTKAATSVSLQPPTGPFVVGSPVQLTAQVNGGANPTGVVTFLSNNIIVGAATLSGETATVSPSNLPAGSDNLQAAYNGDNNNALSVSTVQPVNVTGPPPPVVSLSSNSLNLGSEAVGVQSNAQNVTVTNTGSGLLVVQFVSISGTNAGEFMTGNSCAGVGLNTGASCAIRVRFTPSASGPASATLKISDNVNPAQTVALSGTGIVANPVVSLSATSLNFGSQNVGATSASQTVTLTNTGIAPLNIASVAVTGSGASSFVFVDGCASSIPAGSSCPIHGHFTPTAGGALTAAITITDNASDSPESVTLTGTGLGPAVALSATSLSFGSQNVGTSSASQSVTLTNTGSATLSIGTISVTGTNASSYVFVSSCGSTLAPGANCIIHGHFSPTTAGSLPAAITITDNAGDSPESVSLSGTGAGAPAVTLSSTSLAFGSQNVGTSSASQSVTLTNAGNATLNIGGITVTGAGASSYVFVNSCGPTLSAGSNCIIHGHFAPTTAGSLPAAITITDNASDSPESVTLSGTGAGGPAVTLSSTSLLFGSQSVGTSSASQSVTLTNTGNATLTISNIAVTGTGASSYVFVNSCGSTLSAGSNCIIHGHFAPTTAGSLPAAITITDNASDSPESVSLSGTGTGAPAVTLSTTNLSFVSQNVGTSSASQSVTLTNTGNATLTIGSIAVTGTGASSYVFVNSCGSSLSAGSSCIIHGHFAPTTVGALTAAITITDNASDSPESVALSGTGQ